MRKSLIGVVFVLCVFLLGFAFAQKKPEATYKLQLEGAKLAPVNFPHETHIEKLKIECNICHHKDAASPEKCTKCHLVGEVKDNAPVAKDAFHKTCVDCHKKEVAQGKKAPTKCTECHKK